MKTLNIVIVSVAVVAFCFGYWYICRLSTRLSATLAALDKANADIEALTAARDAASTAVSVAYEGAVKAAEEEIERNEMLQSTDRDWACVELPMCVREAFNDAGGFGAACGVVDAVQHAESGAKDQH